ncbi:SpoIIE family protein phosphatase [Cellulomonas wangsupingiae]|uniref:SpoIIE family protein phosphatase n=1 Tax=Cellulomonas wangsupingiae TaxID=2968085 RepID=A0ABY5K5W4_9CELL|nr:SpoIIE family protein phosphatase [Cellulomonas wangsupingiae]MCC2336074.1 SpoIIE family protein phosphatase [Cellulomonas wangsupingiae]UUI64796.1 SpoIIE family protein phosphatase [Cellulomonas wangsupingiae]
MQGPPDGEEHEPLRVDAREARLALLDSAAQAAGLGTFEWDLTTGALHWDAALLEVFGYDADTFGGTIAAFDARLHAADASAVSAAVDTAIATCGVYEAEFRVVRPDGTVRWLSARGRALAGPSGQATHLIGVTTDTTALRERDLQVQQVLEGMSTGYFWLDEDWLFRHVNAEAELILATTRADLLGNSIWELFPAALGTPFEEHYRAVARTGEPRVFDAWYPPPLDAWYEVRAVPERGGVAVYFTDVTERRRALEQAEEGRARADLLARVAAVMADAVEPVQALEAVLPHLVPAVADFAIASLLDDGTAPWRTRLRDVAALHADPRTQPLLDEYRSLRVPALSRTSLVAEVLTTSRPALRYGSPSLEDIVNPGPVRDLLARLAPETLMVLPLRGRGRTRGVVTLARGADRDAFRDTDVAALRDVTAQIGLALDNAHLHSARRDLTEELQRSLLTELPEPDHLHLVARYVPASTGTQIGGDWYDAFLLRDGCTCLVIGDVTGHDLQAAVKMAQIRNVLRGGAHAVVQPPAAILSAFDWAAQDLAIDALSTAVLARIEQPPDLAERGLRLLRWSNAGHLPPLLVRPDGRAELLRRPSDVLLGLRRHAVRHDHTEVIAPGATVLLYTDGLVEHRGERLDVSLERLRASVERLAHLPLEEFCDAVLDELTPSHEDDVALLAMRAFPEDESRPPESGPEKLPEGYVATES